MFNFEQSVSQWRQQMLAAGIREVSVLELESHLRDEFEKQIRQGISCAEAFDSAVAQMGRPVQLNEEFSKTGEIGWGMLWKLKRLFHRINLTGSFIADCELATKQALDLAAEESRHFHHDFVGTEHLLMGLLRLESGMVGKILRRLGVEDKAVRVEIEKLIGKGVTSAVTSEIPYTPRATNALRLASREARALNHRRITPGHVFLGLILEGDGVAWRALKNLGIRIEDVRREFLVEMGNNPGPA
jgi:hypothetical protein